jgi:hypothetical protein
MATATEGEHMTDVDTVGELLTYLPPWPHCIPLNKLCEDMRLGVRQMTTLTRTARTQGYDVQIKAKGNHQYRYMMAGQYGWCKIEDRALEYWRLIYEEPVQ